MKTRLHLEMLPQPDDMTCGPTCLHAVYQYYGDDCSLESVIRETPRLENGGTLASLLGCQALRRGYRATIYTYHLHVFDPMWFTPGAKPLVECLAAEKEAKESARMHEAIDAYIEFLRLGGQIRMKDLTPRLIRKHLDRSIPILTGLSATYLYRSVREFGPKGEPDDIRGYPAGHFVVLCGYNRQDHAVLVADPLHTNPFSTDRIYMLGVNRVICAVLLGILTYDANLLIIEPGKKNPSSNPADRLTTSKNAETADRSGIDSK